MNSPTTDPRPTPKHLAEHIARDFAPGEVLWHGWESERVYLIRLVDDVEIAHEFGHERSSIERLLDWWFSPSGRETARRVLGD